MSSESTGQLGKRLVLLVTGLVTLALVMSAGHSFFTFTSLRTVFLENRVRAIAELLDGSVRGPGRLVNLEPWQELFEETLEAQGEDIELLALIDRQNHVLLRVGSTSLAEETPFEELRSDEVFFGAFELSAGRGRPPWMSGTGPAADRLIVGVSTSSTDFISQQAYVHLAISGAAIVVLWSLSYYLLRTTRRLVTIRLREESERNLATLGRMSATLAHEIRNPLGAMKGLTQVIQEELPKGHSAQGMITTIVAEAERLEHLVTDLLTFARPGPAKLSECNVVALVDEMVRLLGPEAEDQGVSLRLDSNREEIAAVTEVSGLKQVLLNTLRNALEASPRDGTVQIGLETAAQEKFAVLEICDEGPGLGDEDPEEFFEPFRTTKLQGSGLGLPISRQILERLGGSIQLSNRVPRGTRCRIELPLQSAEKQSAAEIA